VLRACRDERRLALVVRRGPRGRHTTRRRRARSGGPARGRRGRTPRPRVPARCGRSRSRRPQSQAAASPAPPRARPLRVEPSPSLLREAQFAEWRPCMSAGLRSFAFREWRRCPDRRYGTRSGASTRCDGCHFPSREVSPSDGAAHRWPRFAMNERGTTGVRAGGAVDGLLASVVLRTKDRCIRGCRRADARARLRVRQARSVIRTKLRRQGSRQNRPNVLPPRWTKATPTRRRSDRGPRKRASVLGSSR
jgi:hypothetical protein